MEKLHSSQRALLATHILKLVLDLFINTFLVSAIVNITPNTIFSNGLINIGIFYVSWFITYPVLNIILSHFVDKSNRVYFLRMGIMVNAIMLTLLVFWGNQISEWLVVAGFLCGMADAFYYSSYLLLRTELNTKATIKRYGLMSIVVNNAVKIIAPTILGFLIDLTSYSYVALYVVFIALAQFALTFFIKSKKPEGSKFELLSYLKLLKADKDFRGKVKYTYINGILASFKSVYRLTIVILTIYTFKTNLNLGIFTSIFSLITIGLLLIYKRFEAKNNANRFPVYIIVGTLPLIASIVMCIWLNKFTLIIMNFFLTISLFFNEYVGTVERDAIMKILHKESYISEHQCIVETTTCFFRILAYAMFCVCGIFGKSLIFKIYLCIIMVASPLKTLVLWKQRKVRQEIKKNEEICKVKT